jgi:hypothetical protein
MFETSATQAREDGWGDYDPDVALCDCGTLLNDDELLAGGCKNCLLGIELVPAGVVRRYKDEGEA